MLNYYADLLGEDLSNIEATQVEEYPTDNDLVALHQLHPESEEHT